ncbi:hypothetical protein WJX82_003064 [Trebouxia sp. C0006]
MDICAICLSPIGEEREQSDEEAFLDNCYHRFHQQHWVDNMAAAVSPFSTDHAVRFAQELRGFLSSNLSVTGHDLYVFGEDVHSSQAPQNQQSGHELATILDQDSSSTSRQSSQEREKNPLT